MAFDAKHLEVAIVIVPPFKQRHDVIHHAGRRHAEVLADGPLAPDPAREPLPSRVVASRRRVRPMVRWSLLAAPGGDQRGTRAGMGAVAAGAPAGRGGRHGGILRRRRHGAGVAAEVPGALGTHGTLVERRNFA